MAQITLNPTADVRLDSGSPTSNFGGNSELYMGESNAATNVWRSLLKFSFTDIPAGSTITEAVLTLTVLDDLSDNARTMSAFRVLQNWVEAQATWNVYSTGNAWGTAGCANTTSDREATDIGTTTQPANPAIDSTVSITLTAAKVQEWLDAVLSNYGFLLQVATETDDAIGYKSREAGAGQPSLLITYTPPPSGFLAIL